MESKAATPAPAEPGLSQIRPLWSGIRQVALSAEPHPELLRLRMALYRRAPLNYGLFWRFVSQEIAPYMEGQLQEEVWYKPTFERWIQNRFSIDEIHRGGGKSEWGIWHILLNAVRQPKNPWWDLGGERFINQQLIVSSGRTEVDELGDRLKDYCLASPLLRMLVPEGASPTRTNTAWNKNKVVLRNGSAIHFRQVKCRRGLQVGYIWMDDLITESSTLSDRETLRFVTGVILPMGAEQRACVRLTGTPLRASDIIHEMDRSEQFSHQRLPAITNWEQKQPLSKRFSWESLMAIRRVIHPAKFESEYMLNISDSQQTIIRREWLESCLDKTRELCVPEQQPDWRSEFYAVYGGVDFAFADIATADWSVYATIGDRGEGISPRFVLLDFQRFQGRSLLEQLSFLRSWHDRWQHDLIGLEANSIRSSVKDLRSLALPLKLYWTGTTDEKKGETLRPENIISVSKRNFALRQGVLYESRQMLLPFKGERARDAVEQLILESISWALDENKLVEVGIHPDIPIAVGYALETALGHTFAIG